MNTRRHLLPVLAALFALGLAVVPSANAFPKPSGELIPGAEETVLRLHDLPPGYEVGDESGCGALGPVVEADWFKGRFARRYMNWVFKYRPEGCAYQYEQVFEVPGLEPAPPLVEALTVNTPNETAASSGFGLVIRLFNHDKEGRYRKTVSIPPSGVQASLFRSKNELVEGRIHQPATILFWRSGKLISFVEAAGMNPRRNDSAALHFAQIQQERLEHPSAYTEAEQDDSEVRIDDPGLKFPIYWVGHTLEPGGDLPPIALETVFIGAGPPGEKYEIDYEGFYLGGWGRHGWRQFQRSTLGKLNLRSPCAHKSEVNLTDGRAVVYAGYSRRHGGTCPHRPPKHYWAVAHIGGMIVGVQLTICSLCVEFGYGPYNSRRGIEAILHALTLRPKSVYAMGAG